MYPRMTQKLDDSALLLDQEFDFEDEDLTLEPASGAAPLIGERAWEDQLDNGEEMSL